MLDNGLSGNHLSENFQSYEHNITRFTFTIGSITNHHRHYHFRNKSIVKMFRGKTFRLSFGIFSGYANASHVTFTIAFIN